MLLASLPVATSCEATCKGFSGTFTEGALREEIGWASGLSSGKWAYSNEYLMRRARHAVLTTLYSRAQQPGRAGAFLEGHMQTAAQTPDELQNVSASFLEWTPSPTSRWNPKRL